MFIEVSILKFFIPIIIFIAVFISFFISAKTVKNTHYFNLENTKWNKDIIQVDCSVKYQITENGKLSGKLKKFKHEKYDIIFKGRTCTIKCDIDLRRSVRLIDINSKEIACFKRNTAIGIERLTNYSIKMINAGEFSLNQRKQSNDIEILDSDENSIALLTFYPKIFTSQCLRTRKIGFSSTFGDDIKLLACFISMLVHNNKSSV